MANVYRKRIYDEYVRTTRGSAEVGTAALDCGRRRPYLERVVRRHFPAERSASILDLGCGAGELLAVARAMGYEHLAGVDVSPEQVARAQAGGVPDVRCGDFLTMLADTDRGAHDVVVCFDVLEHFTKDELLPIVDGVRRILRPGGRWIIHVPNGASPFVGSVRYDDFTHEQAFTSRSLQQLLTASGFSSVESFEDTPVPHGAKSAIRWVAWRALRLTLRAWIAVETGNTSGTVFSQNLLAVAHVPP